MNRRTFLCGLTLWAASAALAAEAQQAGKVYRVAVILAGSPVSGISKNPFLNAFSQRLRELGYVEGQNIAIARLSAEGRAERHGDLVAEALRLNPDVLVTVSSPMALVAKRATTTIPIVMATSIGPVERGIVPSLARPGGNITGLTIDVGPEIEGKRLELLKQAAPKTVRVAYIGPRFFWEGQSGAAAREAARALGVDLVFVETAAPEHIRNALVTARRERLDALYACDCPATFAARRVIAEFAVEHRLPAVSSYRDLLHLEVTEQAAQKLGIELRRVEVLGGADGLDAAFREAREAHCGAIVTIQSALFYALNCRLADLALKYRLPVLSSETGFAQVGGLMNYGDDTDGAWRRSAFQVDRILKGAKPADLPVEQPTKFELVINLKTAKALGLTIPQSLLIRADQLIE